MVAYKGYKSRKRLVRVTAVLVPLTVIFGSALFFLTCGFGNDWEFNHVHPDSLSNQLKYILIWHSPDYAPFNSFGHGREAFITNKCPENRCYVTSNRHLQKDVAEFDAIAFNGRTMNRLRRGELPLKRSPWQKYLYFNTESSVNCPVGPKWFNNFFNWTLTYRLDSDIPYLYMQVTSNEGEVLGPKPNIKWVKKMKQVPKDLVKRLSTKTKPVAWFVSNCHTKSKREIYVKKLHSALSSYGLGIDVYGSCGNRSCSSGKENDCNEMLKTNYLFYLAYENSRSEDYVTEKVLRSFDYDTVPIVYGGANYSRFLPPNSYIDSSTKTPIEVAAIIARSMHSLTLYQQFFRWRSHYTYSDPGDAKICAVCAALHNKTLMEKNTVYKDLRAWWNER